MDYYCGGDLLTLLSKFEDRLPEDMARLVSEVLGVARGIGKTVWQKNYKNVIPLSAPEYLWVPSQNVRQFSPVVLPAIANLGTQLFLETKIFE